MTDYTDSYVDLLIKQYWEQPKARGEIELQAASWEKIRDILDQFVEEFDVDLATGDRLDIIGKIVGVSRVVPLVIPKVYFGFDDNTNARGFDDKFSAVEFTAPFRDKFERSYTDLELSDNDYRFFIKAKIALNNGSGYMVSDVEVSIQSIINTLFDGEAYVVDKKTMNLVLYVSPSVDLVRLDAILKLGLLPKPQGVGYSVVVQTAVGETFGFADNPDSLGFANRFDLNNEPGGRFAEKVLI